MRIQIRKFGPMLSRQAGSEAAKAFQPTLRELKAEENLEIDFEGVLTFSPSWGDEFLSPLASELHERLVLLPSDNLSVQATVRLLEEISKQKFRTQS